MCNATHDGNKSSGLGRTVAASYVVSGFSRTCGVRPKADTTYDIPRRRAAK